MLEGSSNPHVAIFGLELAPSDRAPVSLATGVGAEWLRAEPHGDLGPHTRSAFSPLGWVAARVAANARSASLCASVELWARAAPWSFEIEREERLASGTVGAGLALELRFPLAR